MTTTIAANVKKSSAKTVARYTYEMHFAEQLAVQVARTTTVTFPSPKYREDPVAFFCEVLGVEPWEKQIEIIHAILNHKRVSVRSGHKVSKDLTDDTPILTPRGWTTHGELDVGSEVYAPDGSVTRVVSTTRYASQPIMRVHFEDGSYIDASETHDWVVRSRELRKPRNAHKPSVKLTTRELFEAQRVPNGSGRMICNWTIDLAAPLQADVASDLPIDPYLLGLWLGDGGTNQAIFTGIDGLESEFASRGFEITKLKSKPSWYVRGILPALREAGVLGSKHVPERYKRASEEQRVAVLRGLMDTDGSCTKRGRATFTNTNRQLALDVAELARSIGQKVRVAERRAMLRGRDCGPCWVVQWASSFDCFGLKRKSARLKTKRAKKVNAHKRIAIDRIERLEAESSTQCIEVDHPTHLYLAGESLIPTHNSHTSAGVALWFYCSFPDARVVMTSTTARQVDDILWLEVKKMRARSGLCVECKKANKSLREHERIKAPCQHSAIIDGKIGELARTGLVSEDFREIKGFTAREAEAMAGTSGANLLYIVDEASGVKQEIFDAIEGNRAGGARIALFSNPTKTSGEFYDSHNSKSEFYTAIKVSSEDTPNAQYGDDDPRAIPGLAGKDWIEEKEEEWGRDSAQFKVRVLGEFAELEDGKIFSIHMIAEAEELHKGMPLDMSARPYVGLDVAGEGPLADEIVWAPRRGKKMLDFVAKRGLTKEAILMHTLSMCTDEDFCGPREVPVVVMDREGKEGAEVYGHFVAYMATTDEPAFELVGVRASDKAHRTPMVYDRMRDELAGVLFDWMRNGGAIPEDTKFAAELHAFEWINQTNGRIKITPKKEIKKELKRSPDRYDAAVLCVWEPLSLRKANPRRKETIEHRYDKAAGMDPYAGVDQWNG